MTNDIEFLLYYGIIGLRQKESDFYIYDVNYDPSLLRVRVKREPLLVEREIHALARHKHPAGTLRAGHATFSALRDSAERWEIELERRANEARLQETEATQEELWSRVHPLLSQSHPRYATPVSLIARLHELARDRGDMRDFRRRLRKLPKYGRSDAFMSRLKDMGI